LYAPAFQLRAPKAEGQISVVLPIGGSMRPILRVYALGKVEAVAQPPDVLHISGVLIEDEDEPAFV
jgi:hypothetical protein